MYVYVINKNKKPLMPCTPAKAKNLLKANKAKVVRKTPFTIQLLWDCEENVQEVVAGMDTGSKIMGSAAIANGKVMYQSEIQLRQDVSKKMQQRKMYRRTRRNRKTRYRKVRWENRSSMRKEGRLAPSIKSKVDSHMREKKFIESILPISKWKVETASFDIHKITNPKATKLDYQNGRQKDFYNVKAFVLNQDNYQCQKCNGKKERLHVHHIIFKSKSGTNEPDNLITLCETCHKGLHSGNFEIKGRKSKTKYATEMGIVKSQLRKYFGHFEEVYGYETKFKRDQIFKLPKSHYIDAIAICCEDDEIVSLDSTVYYKRHVSKGDYQQTKGKRSEIKIPTKKLFGLRKFDRIQTLKGAGFINGKRQDGRFSICDIFWNVINGQVQIKKYCKRLSARATTLIDRKECDFPSPCLNTRESKIADF